MKLKNKLLPLIGTAAVVATAAPIALTSCVTTTDSGEWVNMLNPYSPTIAKYATCGMDEDTAKTAYFGSDETEWLDEEEVAERLMQDYLWSYSHGFTVGKNKRVKYTYNYNNLKFNYIRFGQATTYKDIYHVDSVTVPTISFEVEYKRDYTYDQYWNDVKYNYVVSGVLTITNLPITLSFNDIRPGEGSSQSTFNALAVVADYYTLSRSEQLQSSGNYHGKIPFSYVDEYKLTTNVIQNENIQTSERSAQILYYSGCFTGLSGLQEFIEDYCPAFCSYYMLSVYEK